MINYDLPWNPQRVEQRIGRVHRYGQKNDVVVVNFINKGNRADERVFELLSQKFQLFEGVFGASDEVLGSIESGVDIERRIHDIYQRCRSDEQIEFQFNQLQSELKEQLEAKNSDARRSLFEHFDSDVVNRLNIRRSKTEIQLSTYQQSILLLARMALQDQDGYQEENDSFVWQGNKYSLNWQIAEEGNGLFFRPHDGLGSQLIAQAKLAQLSPAELRFTYSPNPKLGQWVDVKTLIDSAGVLNVTKVIMESTAQRREQLLLSAMTDQGDLIHHETIERLLQLPLKQSPVSISAPITNMLDKAIEGQLHSFQADVERDNETYYGEEVEKLERWAEDKRIALDIRTKQLDQEIKEARKVSRQLTTLQEKMAAKRQLKQLERERDNVMLRYHEEKKEIEQEEDRLLEEIEARLATETKIVNLFTVRWQLGIG